DSHGIAGVCRARKPGQQIQVLAAKILGLSASLPEWQSRFFRKPHCFKSIYDWIISHPENCCFLTR
ncbi:MAG: hypothetical protein RR376_27205, partial [Janthinobacterium sp.]